ncbi:MAG: hypothetical protein B7C24_10065 [Bacteroidetes bacterium 4572_77]|nr:MAG: hypothetical protein B7C24_10065 [Bacteroidetes bacterium 4572_77]
MSIQINGTRYVNTEIQLCFLTITYDGTEYKYNANTPVLEGSALQDLVDSREDRYVYSILYQEYPGARFKQLEGNSDFDKLKTWIESGHTNTPYCSIAEHATEQDCLANGGKWTPEQIITKVPFKDSHDYTGTLRTRKLEQLNQDLQTYLYTKYDIGTQASLQAIYTQPGTPIQVKDQFDLLFIWISSVMNYYYNRKAVIRDGENWESITWDFEWQNHLKM